MASTTTSTLQTLSGKLSDSNTALAQNLDRADGNKETQAGPFDRTYINFSLYPFPLAPFFERKTVRREVIPDRLWVFEQEQGIGLGLGVSNLTRMTIIKLDSGDLWVHAPIAPTRECVRLVKELGYPVKYIVLATTLYEHKVFAPPFTRKFPKAELWIVPKQFSWPLNFPSQLLGLFPTGTIQEGKPTPWDNEIEHTLLSPPSLAYGGYKFCEATFFHRATKTLLLTDACVFVPPKAPEIIEEQMCRNLGKDDNILFKVLELTNFKGTFLPKYERYLAKRGDPAMDTDEDILTRGWKRICLFALFIAPDGGSILDPEPTFQKIAGKWIVGPVIYTLVLQNVQEDVEAWARRVSRWNFTSIIPCHFAGPAPATPREFRECFSWVDTEKKASFTGPATVPSLQSLLSGAGLSRRPYSDRVPELDIEILKGAAEKLSDLGTDVPMVIGKKD